MTKLLKPSLEADILRLYRGGDLHPGTIARELRIHHGTVRRVLFQAGHLPKESGFLRHSMVDDYLPFIRQTLEKFPTLPASRLFNLVCERGYNGGSAHFRHIVACIRPPSDWSDWMLSVLQKKMDSEEIKRSIGDFPGLPELLRRLYTGRLVDRNKAMSILASRRGSTIDIACTFLGISAYAYRRYLRLFSDGGCDALFARKPRLAKSDDELLMRAVFRVLHEPPKKHGINRTTWTMKLLREVLARNGQSACPDVIRQITRAAGYQWRKARVVLTSTDPTYSAKLDGIQNILSKLGPDECFFSVDEYGPFAVKMYGGRKLVAPGEQLIVPQWQKSRGSLILTAALELSSNQITFFYSEDKNTEEILKMMDLLVARYADRRKLYLSWDAASWHISRQLNLRIEEHNARAAMSGGVIVETAPLPAGAQFLNVIESVFSGMSRAIIHNSDYSSVDTAKAAINRYFEERNDYFQKNPHRAGNKIWGKEREPVQFRVSNNCKDPRYR